MKTSLTQCLDIDLPIIQAPIGSATNAELASAVSNAGGLGMLALSWQSLEVCRAMIRATKQLTALPFGVNLVLDRDQSEKVALCIEEQVPIVSFFWGDPSDYIQELHRNGIKVIQTVSSSSEAISYADKGVDVLMAQGWESGGHVNGVVASSVLLAAITDKVSIPVVGSGGFADGRGLVAALSLGASGVSMGTRFLMSKEAHIEPVYSAAIAAADAKDAIYVEDLFHVGWENAPHRILKNSTYNAWEEVGKPNVGNRPNEHEIVAYDAKNKPVVRYSDYNPIKGSKGDLEALALYAGQTAGIIENRVPAEEIVANIMAEARKTIDRLNNFL